MNNEPIDVDFTEDDTSDKQINGKALYLTTSQCAILLGESDSTIRFWCTKFKDILHIETSGATHRRFKEEDIEKLKYIKKLLREQNYSINQVIEYCSEKDVSVIERKVKESDPMALQSLASAMAIEIGSQLEEYKLQIKDELINEMKQQFNELKEKQQQNQEGLKDFVAITIQNEVKETLDAQMSNIKSAIDTIEQTNNKNVLEKEKLIRQHMEERKQHQELIEQIKLEHKNKPLWKRILNK